MLSSHVTICISGFLSQKCDEYRSWKHLIYDIEHTNLSLYDYRWESKCPENIYGAARNALIDTASSIFSFNGFLAGISRAYYWLVQAGAFALFGVCEVSRLFK